MSQPLASEARNATTGLWRLVDEFDAARMLIGRAVGDRELTDVVEFRRGIGAGRRLTLGINDHVAGPELPGILSKLKAYDPGLLIQVRVNSSRILLAEFDRKDIDVAIVRQGARTGDSEALFDEYHGWYSSIDFE